MKQHTTKEQWDAISEEQKSIFVGWSIKYGFNGSVNRPTIGQMIEFLGDDWLNAILDTGNPHRKKRISTVYKEINLKLYALANILWEAVVYKLNS